MDPKNGCASAKNPESWNRYAFVGNDPINYADPMGLDGGSGMSTFQRVLAWGTSISAFLGGLGTLVWIFAAPVAIPAASAFIAGAAALAVVFGAGGIIYLILTDGRMVPYEPVP